MFGMSIGEYPDWSHEKRQIDQLVIELHAAFGGTPDRVELVVNAIVDGEQVDALIFRNDGLIVVEAKAWEGKIGANFKAENWTIGTGTDESTKPSPVEQVMRKRSATGRVIASLGDGSQESDEATAPIQGWVVVDAGAKLTLTGVGDDDQWFDVIPVPDVARVLREESLPPVLSVAAFGDLIVKLGARRCDWIEWLRRSSPPGIQTVGSTEAIRIPKIDSWLRSADQSLVLKALDFIRDLDLRAYETEVLGAASHQDPAVQWNAFQLVTSWRVPGYRERLAEFVEHSREAIRKPILELLSREPIPEAVAALGRVASQGAGDDVRLAIRALAIAGTDSSKRTLLRLISRRGLKESDPGDFPLQTLVWAVGKAKIEDAVPTLLAMLNWNTFRGMPRSSGSYALFRETIFIALGMIGGPKAREAIAVELRTNKKDPTFGLEAAAELADPTLADLILAYLDASSEALYLVVRALGKARNPVAFERLLHLWRGSLGRDEDSLARELEEALVAIDPLRLEREMAPLIEQHRGWEHLYRLWWVWTKVVSPQSRDSLLQLLEREDSTFDASTVLFRIADDKVLDRARELVRERSGKVRAAALWLLAFKETTEEMERLVTNLALDESPDVRQAVIGAYSRLPEEESRSRILRFAEDMSQDVRDYAFAVLFKHALVWQVRAAWASADGREGSGRVLLLPGTLLLEAKGPALMLPLAQISRVGSCNTLGPGGTLYMIHGLEDRGISFAICLEKDPLDWRVNPAVDTWYEALCAAVKTVRGRRADLGQRGLTPAEGPLAKELVARAPRALED